MEPRRMLAIDLLQIGAVFTEEDLGSDVQGDTFEITFQGGAAGTELTRLIIDGDQDAPGFGEGDVFFDEAASGFGADHSLPFTLISLQAVDPNASVDVLVEDGTSELVLNLTGFRAGDRLIFSIDVDEVEDFDPAETDLAIVNEGFDPITSGVEFQGSRLTAHFSAAHYFDAEGSGEFRNRYDDALDASGLDLPRDDEGGQRDRTDGVMFPVEQRPLPVAIAGTVYLDNSLDLVQDAAEVGLAGVELALWQETGGGYEFSGHTTTTNASGDYEFGLDLELSPGNYEVREAQPAGLFSVGAVPGTVAGLPSGSAASGDRLTQIELPRGGERAVDYDFAEAMPASLSGYVYHDRSNDGHRASGEAGLVEVQIDLIPVDTIAPQAVVRTVTDAAGLYAVSGLSPGDYRIVEVAQPPGYFDGLDAAGTVGGQPRGTATNPGDALESIHLNGGDHGVEYNFGEIRPASISGRVHLSTADGDCLAGHSGSPPLAGVVVQLFDGGGQLVQETVTDANGDYQFDQLLPGEYTIAELTPAGLIDGADHVGSVAGQPRGVVQENDRISVMLESGDDGVAYDFCEHQPASLSGHVYHDRDNDGRFDADEDPIANVQVALLDANGQVLELQQADAAGYYEFLQLPAGNYALRESHPPEWIDGLDAAGTVNGSVVGVADNPGDSIDQIQLRYGDAGIRYDFGELAPVKVGGFVYHDRNDNGVREAGEDGLAGVQIVVVPITTAVPQPVVTLTTDASGMYMTGMISPGNYEIIESAQPAGYLDGRDTPGRVGGQEVGTADEPGDRITEVELSSGQVGSDYNFGELLPSSISGRVHLSDSDGDCFDETTSHAGIGGVELTLTDARGTIVATTTTDATGGYRFAGLLPGSYTVVEQTPDGLLDGGERAGVVAGVVVGAVTSDDTIGAINLLAGQAGIDYDFCEHQPAQLSGRVYHDADNSGSFDGREDPISGVAIELLDASGSVVATDRTGDDGGYSFGGLLAGVYSLREIQPAEWRDGLDSAGFVGSVVVGTAVNPGDAIQGIRLAGGDAGIRYDFGELLPASISGTVHADPNNNCEVDPGEAMLAGVTIELVDASGQVVASTQTDGSGRYAFEDLLPGRYTVREIQPEGFFQGAQRPGSHGVSGADTDSMTVEVASGDQLTDYNFCELPPARLSGYVFQDGPTLITPDGQLPPNVKELRDGRRTPDDTPIAGVIIQLRNGLDGEPINGSAALPGHYGPGAIATATRADGYYEFLGIPGNQSYAVYQLHPSEFIDSLDTAGSTTGLAVNPGDDLAAQVIQRFVDNPGTDAIVQIPLRAGADSTDNNFSEIRVGVASNPVPPPARVAPAPAIRTAFTPPLIASSAPQLGSFPSPIGIPLYGGGVGYTWHLSVVDGGMPRGVDSGDTVSVMVWRQATYLETTRWQEESLRFGRWELKLDREGSEAANRSDDDESLVLYFGIPNGIPIAGDFNGDGAEEVGIYLDGEWFIDLNGNGRWDEGDLWAQLGSKMDRPVTGDWDGDGKDDIGIFGQEWSNDARAIRAEPGLPDVLNMPGDKPKNPPPEPEEAADGRRLLRLRANGPRRADVIDHVFRFGSPRDIPVAADLNGDGIASVGIFRDGQWKLDVDGDGRFGEHDRAAEYGGAGDVPIVGDFDGNGVDEIGVYRDGRWQVDSNRNFEMDAHDRVFEMGGGDDRPVVGDWDGDGADEPAVYQPQ